MFTLKPESTNLTYLRKDEETRRNKMVIHPETDRCKRCLNLRS